MRIGVLTAIPQELRPFLNKKTPARLIAGKRFYQGIHPLHELWLAEGGIGKVNSALCTTLLIREFACELIVVSGTGGALDPGVHTGEVFVGKRLIQYDYGSLVNGRMRRFRVGSIPLGNDPQSLAFEMDSGILGMIREKMPEARLGSFLTADLFLQCAKTRDRLFREFGAQVVDMESAAVAQVASLFEIPMVAIRAVSDSAANSQGNITPAMIKTASRSACEEVCSLLDLLGSEETAETQER